MSEGAIDLQALTKRYGAHAAVSEVSMRVPEGSCLALLGHNGAGKTTLMKLMLGLTRASAGSIAVLGADPGSAGLDFRRRIGFLPENVAFHEEISGLETLRFYARLKKEPLEVCGVLLERVGLTHAAERRVKTYSKGMRQRLGLAQALIGRPRLLLLDEPTTGLDPVLRQEFFRIIQELEAAGATVVLSSHILTELEARTDLIAIMKRGRLVVLGDLDTLRREADLPVRIRVTVSGETAVIAERLGDLVRKRSGEHSLELTCALPDKMAVLGRITALGRAVADIDIELPSLDDVYLRFGHDPEDVS
ncbi:MAG: ABC transporter ATP-binding protein [Magnetococcales bacterium]|nr:ABC transporter ATP-binding protein [Alphaproteobacteria bacterium]MBF0144161.1 ABC transporter ATP-binding protein [Magnetococcales bacterium]